MFLPTRLFAALLPSPITLAFANSEPPGPERFITDLQLAERWNVDPSIIWRHLAQREEVADVSAAGEAVGACDAV